MVVAKTSVDDLRLQAVDPERARNASRPSAPDRFEHWNDRHLGEDIYIIGASPQLSFLTPKQLGLLSKKTLLGGNNTFYKVPLTYFISAYQMEIFKAAMYLPEERLVHMKRVAEEPLTPDLLSISRQVYNKAVGLNRYFTHPAPILYTARNQALAMLHFAIIMGARRVIYIGVDQTNYAYFWQYDEAIREALRRDTHKLLARRTEAPDSGIYFDHVYELLDQPAEVREAMEFYEDLTPIFADYIKEAAAFGVEVIATLENSVVHQAGATYRTLDECLASSPKKAAPPEAAPRKPRAAATPEAKIVPPLLVSGLTPGRRRVAQALKDAGVLMGTPELWSDRAASAVLEWTRLDGGFRLREPLWDYPEPLVEALSRKAKIMVRATQKLAVSFAHEGLIFDLVPAEELDQSRATLWSMRSPWGWDASFDLALAEPLAHLFPGMRLLHIRPARPADLAESLVADFAVKIAGIGGVELGPNSHASRINGEPPRQMHVLNAEAAGFTGPAARFSLRCADLKGAMGLIETYDRLALAAAEQLGSERALIVREEEFEADPEGVMRTILAFVGHGDRPELAAAVPVEAAA